MPVFADILHCFFLLLRHQRKRFTLFLCYFSGSLCRYSFCIVQPVIRLMRWHFFFFCDTVYIDRLFSPSLHYRQPFKQSLHGIANIFSDCIMQSVSVPMSCQDQQRFFKCHDVADLFECLFKAFHIQNIAV